MKNRCVEMLMFVLPLLLLVCEGIPLGSELKPDEQSWVSVPLRNFEFGFRKSNASDMFNLAIWYKMTPDVAVWKATKESDGVRILEVSKDAKAVLKDTGLTVMNGSNIIVWTTTLNCSTSACVANAFMEDSGSFKLFNDKEEVVWNSFASPTDTLLPSQDLVGNTSLISGKYRLSMNESSVGLYFQDYSLNDSYWSLLNQQFSLNHTASEPRLEFEADGNISFSDASGTSWYKDKYHNGQQYTLDYMDNSVLLRRITLASNGTLRSYSLVKSAGDEVAHWRVVWQATLLDCEVYGTCGAFGLCNYHPRKNCFCPPGFRQVNMKDASAGCTRNIMLQCSNNSKMIQMPRTQFLGNDYITAVSNRSVSLKRCEDLCLKDCKCLAALYKVDGSGQCIFKGGKSDAILYNGLQSPQKAFIALIKVSALDKSAISSPDDVFVTSMYAVNVTQGLDIGRKSYFSTKRHIVMFALAIGEFVIFCAAALSLWMCWRRSVQRMWKSVALEKQGATRYSYEQLQIVTNNFSEKLGSGGFGSVYKGKLFDGKTYVAVKNLEVATQGESQFKAEMTTFGRIHHVNLVRLLGYCADDNHKLLVYEYMSNGSLDKVLFSEEEVTGFSKQAWKTRYSIVLGIARGIAYLHEECYERILHCDIKPQNILLDPEFCPKVSDFGLAKLMKKDMALSVTTIRGTRGYLAPEWISNQPITAKADVYSYGMVLLELLSGRDISMTANFSAWAFQKYIAGDMRSIVDARLLSGHDIDWDQFDKTVKVAFWCIQPDAGSRPTMDKVVKMLEDHTSKVMAPPSPLISVITTSGDGSNNNSAAESMSILEPR